MTYRNAIRITGPFVRGIHIWIPLTKGQWCEHWYFLSLTWTSCWTNSQCAGWFETWWHPSDITVMVCRYLQNQAITTGPRFNIKMSSYQYRKSHCGDKTVVRSSYLHNGISYTGKTTSLYWIRAQILLIVSHQPMNGISTVFSTQSVIDLMTSSNGNIFRVTGLLRGEFTGHR